MRPGGRLLQESEEEWKWLGPLEGSGEGKDQIRKERLR